MKNFYRVKGTIGGKGASCKGLRVACVVLLLGVAGIHKARAQSGSGSDDPIIVSNSAELEAALSPVNAGHRIHVLQGEYQVNAPLAVPDGATLEGEGTMLFDADDLPSGFQPGTETRIKAASLFAGDLLTLGDGVTVRGLIVEDFLLRAGGVVVVASRRPGDFVSASIRDCEIIAPNLPRALLDSPTGRGLLVFTQNKAQGALPLPDDDAVVSVEMMRSIVRAPRHTSAVFATNFAARGQVTVSLTGNRLEGQLNVQGGVSRPDEVSGAVTTIHSVRNLYLGLGDPASGWDISAGSSTPFALYAPGTTGHNVLNLDSNDDRIQGFRTGLTAVAGFRQNPLAGPSSDNLVELRLLGTSIRSDAVAGVPPSDLVFEAAKSSVTGVSAGDGNVLRILIRGASGSGPRANIYANTLGPGLPGNFGSGNQLEIIGNSRAFEQTNDGFNPAPPPEFVGR